MNLKVQEDRVGEVLNYIQTNYKLEEILEKYNLMEGCKMSGSSLLIKCPFHIDYDPSMSVNLSKNVYRCFSCGSSGNIVNFLVDYNNKVLDKKCNYFTVMNDLLLSDDKMKLRLGINSIFKKSELSLDEVKNLTLKKSISFGKKDRVPNTFIELSKFIKSNENLMNLKTIERSINLMECGMSPSKIYEFITKVESNPEKLDVSSSEFEELIRNE